MSYYKTKTIMNEKMFARSHRAAEVIYNALAVKSNCFVKANKPVRADFVIAIDDDPRACYFRQVLCGKFIRMALILKLLEVE